jgi:hypothetical protein
MNKELITQIEAGGLQQAEGFIKNFLAVPPPEEEVKILTKNVKYLDISHVENTLDELYFGAWEVTDFKFQVVANELTGSLQLRVFHPVLQIWLSRTGTAAVQIRMYSKGSGGDGDITNVHNKITNALVMDFPHLKTECIKNAARSLGKIFGRDLNRDKADSYEPFTEQIMFEETKKELQHKLNNCNNRDELQMLWDSLDPDQQNDPKVKRLFTVRKAKLIVK